MTSGIDINEPILFKSVAARWPAMSKWTLAEIRNKFGDKKISVFSYKTLNRKKASFEEHFDEILHNPHGAAYYAENLSGDTPFEKNEYLTINSTGYLEDSLARKIYDGSRFPPNEVKCFLLIGGHTQNDFHAHEPVLFLQMVGVKRVYLAAPDQWRYLYSHEGKSRYKESPVDIVNIDFEKYPLLKEATLLVADLEPGDVLYVPNLWFHTFHAFKTPSMSMPCEYRP